MLKMIPHFHFSRISSTNEIAKELLKKEKEFFVSADYQYSGKGRKGRYWAGDSYKNIYLSYAVDHSYKKAFKNVPLYQAAGCLAVKRMLADLYPELNLKIKYPNDICVVKNDKLRKISGVLTEHSYKGNQCINTIIGIGVNVCQKEFLDDLKFKAISLKMLGIDAKVEELTNTLKENLIEVIEYDEDNLFEIWKNELRLLNKIVKNAENGKKLIIKEINPDCSLLAERNGEDVIINNGDTLIYEL